MRVRPCEVLLVTLVSVPMLWGSITTRPFAIPRAPAARIASATELLQEGLHAFNAGNPREAHRIWQQAMVLEPEWPAAHNDLGMALMGLYRARDARPHFVRAVELAPGEQLYKNNLAWCDRELASPTLRPSPR